MTPAQEKRCAKSFFSNAILEKGSVDNHAVDFDIYAPLGGMIGEIEDDQQLEDQLECRYLLKVKNKNNSFSYKEYLELTSQTVERTRVWLEQTDHSKMDRDDEDEHYRSMQRQRALNAIVAKFVFGRDDVRFRIEEGDGYYWLMPQFTQRPKDDNLRLSLGLGGDNGFPSFASDARAAVYILEHYRKKGIAFSVRDRGSFGIQTTIGTNSKVGGKWGDAMTQKFETSICWSALRFEGVLPL